MKKTTIKKWAKRFGISVFILSIVAYFYVDYQINHLWGAHTKVVEHNQFNVPQENTIITNVNILSQDGKQMIADQTVIIEKGVITPIGSDIKTSKASLIIDGKGKYLIPGLIDSHIHLWQSPNDLLLYIANGVTQIRELNGSKLHLKWREEIKAGRIGPKMFVASSRVNSNGIFASWFQKWAIKITSINSFNDAKSIVQSNIEAGYDAIKTYTFINNKDYWSLNKAAKEAGIPLLGHTPIGMTLKEVWTSDQKELAHIEELVKALIREFDGFDGFNDKTSHEFLDFVQQRSGEIADNLLKHNIAVVSTLWLTESFAKQKEDLDKMLNRVELVYANPGITELSPITSRAMGWLPEANIYRLGNDVTPEKKKRYLTYWNAYAQAHQILLKAMVEKQVIILAGTDANVPVAVPGFSLHDELISLTQSGMDNTQALLSASKAPANWMKQKSGIVKQGYRADLILLNKNPLNNIKNTKSINTVILNGKVLNRQKLDAILSAVKSANDESRRVDISGLQ
ncbi:MAG: amidohydrolase family protein [Pseudomonadota bacterium]